MNQRSKIYFGVAIIILLIATGIVGFGLYKGWFKSSADVVQTPPTSSGINQDSKNRVDQFMASSEALDLVKNVSLSSIQQYQQTGQVVSSASNPNICSTLVDRIRQLFPDKNICHKYFFDGVEIVYMTTDGTGKFFLAININVFNSKNKMLSNRCYAILNLDSIVARFHYYYLYDPVSGSLHPTDPDDWWGKIKSVNMIDCSDLSPKEVPNSCCARSTPISSSAVPKPQ